MDGEITQDALLGGRVRLAQPKAGFRAAIDPVLLAAAVPAVAGETILDAGSGTGAAALCLAVRVPGADVTGIEIDPALAALANANAAENGLVDRVRFIAGDLFAPPPEIIGTPFNHVFSNPPYLAVGAGSPSPDPGRRRATVEGAGGLAAWLDACLRFLRPEGTLTLIHRADRLDDVLALLAGRVDESPRASYDASLPGRAGGIVVFPLWPGVGKAAKRVIVVARSGSAAPLEIKPGLVLHGPGGAYTPEAEAILRAGRAIRF